MTLNHPLKFEVLPKFYLLPGTTFVSTALATIATILTKLLQEEHFQMSTPLLQVYTSTMASRPIIIVDTIK